MDEYLPKPNILVSSRKMGIAITESKRGNNTIKSLAPSRFWANIPASGRAVLLPKTIQLPGPDGQPVTWYVNEKDYLVDTWFEYLPPRKKEWMRWENILFTEDSSDIEWIIRHPDEVQKMSYYQDQLVKLNKNRGLLRDSLKALGLNTQELVLSMSLDPQPGEVFEYCFSDTLEASAQITIESVDRSITKKCLYEGLSYGMNKKVIGGRPPFVEVDNVIVQAVKDLAGRWNVPAIDRELITLFIVGDLCHKVATLTPGILWHDGPAKFKNWRLFFPRSHPYQLLLQSAVNLPPTGEMIKAIKVALNEQRQAFVNGVLELCVTKIMAKCFYPEWSQENYQEKQPDGTILVKDPHDFVLKAVVFGEPPPGEYPHLKLKTALSDFLNKNYPDFLAIEFGNVVDALVDSTGKTSVNVVRSERFASHKPQTVGFAFEDRHEVETDFPDLKSTFDRLKGLAFHF